MPLQSVGRRTPSRWRLGLLLAALVLGLPLGGGFAANLAADGQLDDIEANQASPVARIEAEDYKPGGEGIGYDDTTKGNSGGAYRDDDVDIQATDDVGGGYNVGWIRAGEWLAYDLDVATDGDYAIDLRVSAESSGQQFYLTLDGEDISGSMTVPNTGDWQRWTTVRVGPVAAPAGQHELRLVVDTGYFNVNYIELTSGDQSINLPGRFEAEDYNTGGEGIGYHDSTEGNRGGAYRDDDVDILACDDDTSADSCYGVGWIEAGEWLAYDVTVSQSSSFVVSARVASPMKGREFHLELNGQDLTGPIVVPDTDGWQRWMTVTAGPFAIAAGDYELRVVADGDGFNLDNVELTEATATLAGAGDIARCDSSGDEATAALLDGFSGVVYTTGDNAYPDGTDDDFADCYDPSWGRFKAQTRPAPGNHDYHTKDAAGYFAYFGAAAGDPDEGYYSYDLGAWHIIVLNSECNHVGGCDAGSRQEQWLRQDLAAHPVACTLAYWHHPRFSSGEHGDDLRTQALWNALYQYGADVVLNGHDHQYERFAPQTPAGLADPVHGIRQFVVGTGGASHDDFVVIQPNSEVRSNGAFGILKLSLSASSYSWQFVPVAGKSFTDSGTGYCH